MQNVNAASTGVNVLRSCTDHMMAAVGTFQANPCWRGAMRATAREWVEVTTDTHCEGPTFLSGVGITCNNALSDEMKNAPIMDIATK